MIVNPIALDEMETVLQSGALKSLDPEQKARHKEHVEMLQGRYVKLGIGCWRQVDDEGCFHNAKLLLVHFDGTDRIA